MYCCSCSHLRQTEGVKENVCEKISDVLSHQGVYNKFGLAHHLQDINHSELKGSKTTDSTDTGYKSTPGAGGTFHHHKVIGDGSTPPKPDPAVDPCVIRQHNEIYEGELSINTHVDDD